jgi:hypothetical protein
LAAALAALEQQFAVQPSTEIGELQQQIDALAQAVAIQPAALPLNSGAFFNIIGPATAGSVAYGDGSSIAFSAAGSSGQLLASSGAGAPTWTSLSSIGVTSISFGTTGLTPATATSGVITVAGTLVVANGGTGQTSYTNGQLLIGNTTGNTLAKATLTASTGISVTNGAGSITLTNTAPDQVVSLTGAGTTTISGAYPSFTITSNDAYVGTVTSVGLSLPTQFTVTNSPVTSSGTLTAAWNTQTANYVLAGPTTGAAAVPTFRALVAGDVPALSYVSSVSATAPITSTGGLTPTIAVTSAALTKTDDTNVTLTLGGSPTTALLAATSLTLGWTGTLAAARLNANVVQSVVNDTNVTGSIATQALTLGWTGTLSVARGGTAKASWTANGIVYASGTTTLTNGTALTFDGTNWATTGTASATKFIPTGGTATGNGMYLPAANTLAWSNNGAETMRLDSSGNLGVGDTPNAGWGSNASVIQVAGTGSVFGQKNANIVSFMENAYFDNGAFRYIATDTFGALKYTQYQQQHTWSYAGSGTAGAVASFTTAMTLDAFGNLLVGTTTNSQTSRSVIKGAQNALTLDNSGAQYTTMIFANNDAAKAYMFYDNTNSRLYVQTGGSGGVYLAATGIAWIAVSDERIKDIIEPIDNAAQKIANWRTVIGKYKSDKEGTRRSFLIAQDVLETFPEAVDTTNPDEYGLNYQDLIPVLVKAMQEQQAAIETLTARLTALENK